MSSMPRACLLLLLALGALACSRSAEEDAALVRTNRLSIFATENANIAPGAVVFLGGSTVERWDLAASFATIAAARGGAKPDMRCVNRGVADETVLELADRIATALPPEPATVVLHAGAFDLFALNASAASTAEQLLRILRGVRVHSAHSRIIFLPPLPSADISDSRLEAWKETLRLVRAQQFELAFEVRDLDSDYLLTTLSRLHAAYSSDGTHPNAAGYAVLAKLLGQLP